MTVLIFGTSGDSTLRELMRLPGRAFVTDAWETGVGRVLTLEEAVHRMTGLPSAWSTRGMRPARS